MFGRRSSAQRLAPAQGAPAVPQPSTLPPGAVAVPITPAQAKLFFERFSAMRQIDAQVQAAGAMVCEGRVLGLAGTPDAPELVVMPAQSAVAESGA